MKYYTVKTINLIFLQAYKVFLSRTGVTYNRTGIREIYGSGDQATAFMEDWNSVVFLK